jgi:hypothetical protein
MLFLYVSLILLLLVARFLIRRRVVGLERKYARAARQTDELFREPRPARPGNSNKPPDPYLVARQAYVLGQAVERRERVEAKYIAWQKFADRFGGLVAGLRGWKGRKLPYAVGVLDVLLAAGVLDYLGYREHMSLQALVDLFHSITSGSA